MKNQYVGDSRDYFKLDLLDALASSPHFTKLTCLWMLTPPDNTGQGTVAFTQNQQLPQLNRLFMQLQRARARRRLGLSDLDPFLRRHGAGYTYVRYPARDADDNFGSASRAAYFHSFDATHLANAVVFFDPDTGMEPASGPLAAHLAFDELKRVTELMNGASVAVVYQHQRRLREWVTTIGDEIAGRVSPHVASVSEGHVAFFVIANNSPVLDKAMSALTSVGDRAQTRAGRRIQRRGWT